MTRQHGSPIPWEGQTDRESNRTCGAAALTMVYRSLPRPPSSGHGASGPVDERRDRRARTVGSPDGFERRRGSRRGIDVSQADILPRISKPNRLGQASCATHLMVKDALGRGYAAVAVRATNPLQALFTCQQHGIRVVLNHRLKPESGAGHFTVLTGFESDSVLVHDPYFGPHHRIAFADLLELWQPKLASSEIVGNVLIGIATPAADPRKCRGCGLEIPVEVPCARCEAPVPLSPAPVLGCIGESCIFRGWDYVCCPTCDFMWSFAARPAAPAKAPDAGPWDLGAFFAELDKFETHVRADKAAMKRKDVQAQLATIRENREKLRLAEYEEKARIARAEAQATEFAGKVKAEEAAIEQAKAEAAKPAAPIDAARLGDALLKDLGIVKG